MRNTRQVPKTMDKPGTKRQIKNPDGSRSTEQTIGIQTDRGHVNIPTIVKGKKYTDEQAIDMHMRGRNPAVGIYKSREEAEKRAQIRSSSRRKGTGRNK